MPVEGPQNQALWPWRRVKGHVGQGVLGLSPSQEKCGGKFI